MVHEKQRLKFSGIKDTFTSNKNIQTAAVLGILIVAYIYFVCVIKRIKLYNFLKQCFCIDTRHQLQQIPNY